MQYSANLMVFDDTVDDAVLDRFAQLKELGFDGVEVPVFSPDSVDTAGIRRRAEACGLQLTVSGALPPGTRFYGADAGARQGATRYVEGFIRTASELGAGVVCGPIYKPVGDTDQSVPLAQQIAETADAMRPLMKQAEAAGVQFAFEPLNRFETDFMNTASAGIEFCARLGSPAAGLLLDTFHMHIEEKAVGAAIRAAAAAGVLTHFHASENDRGTAGSGQVRWDQAADALTQAKYDGWVVLESFSQTNQAIKTAVSCWRPFFPSEEEFLANGLAFVKGALAP